ncbi:MAG: hypothetical protein KKD63_15445 [Proteobacteria bacterium]|nr:hypothetical protein [Pseudomonadota bacterium]
MPNLASIITALEPEEAVRQLSPLLRPLLSHLDKDTRLAFIASLSGDPDDDKVTSLVHL